MEMSEIMEELDLSLPGKIEDSKAMAFDDEPLEQILYGKVRRDPTPANLYLPAIEYVQKIVQNYQEGKIKETLEQAAMFLSKGYFLSAKMCWKLLFVMKGLVPHYPNPIIQFDLSTLGPLMEKMWEVALRTENKGLQEKVGESLYRWYEHQQKYKSARQVLTILIEIARERGDRIGEAVMVNNFAFEYLLEGGWREAAPLFEEAANIFKEKGIDFEYANARANYWTARCEYASFEEIEKTEYELKTIAVKLDKHSDWRTRKPLILLAKIEEKKNNLTKAIRLVQDAIKKSQGSNTRYPEIDEEYLINLQKQGKYIANIA